MPLQNRVRPDGEIEAVRARGTMMGNRGGCFHREDKTLKPRRWSSRQWICCVLSFKARRRRVFSPGLYTELFFLDEATALAAGHRPCFECRRADAVRFAATWAEAHALEASPRASDIDAVLHAERIASAPESMFCRLRTSTAISNDRAAAAPRTTPIRVMKEKVHSTPRSGRAASAVPPSTGFMCTMPA